MDQFEQWYVDTYYKLYGFVPPTNLFERYEDTYIREDVYRHNLVWQHQQAKMNNITEAYAKLSHADIQNRLLWVDSIKKRDELQKRINKAKEIADELMQSSENYKLGELLEKVLKGDLDEISKS